MNVHRLRLIRRKHGLPIAAVSVRSGVSTGTLNLIEVHGHEPRLETKHRLARSLGVDVQQIWPVADQSDPLPAE